MNEDLHEVQQWVGGLLSRLSDGERLKLARRLAADLRKSQAQRIAQQKNPDGSAFQPRKTANRENLRDKQGRLKRKVRARAMFVKLRRASYLTGEARASEIAVGFKQTAIARVARVHQEGLRDRVARDPGSANVTYPRRKLLGLTDVERAHILNALSEFAEGFTSRRVHLDASTR